jgi:hypothetical protein
LSGLFGWQVAALNRTERDILRARIEELAQQPIPVPPFGMDGISDDPDEFDVAADWMLEWVIIFYRYDLEAGVLDVLRIQVVYRIPEDNGSAA